MRQDHVDLSLRVLALLVLLGLAIVAAPLALAREASGSDRPLEEGDRAAPPGAGADAGLIALLLRTHVHGITPEISRDEIGVGAVPELLRLLRDPDFPRRDNVVAHLGHLGGADTASALLELLAHPVGSAFLPEEERALLLAPQALGLLAKAGDPVAFEALLAMTSPQSDGSLLAGAASVAPGPQGFLADLENMALRGLALSARSEALARLELLTEGPSGSNERDRRLWRDARQGIELWESLRGPSSPSGGSEGLRLDGHEAERERGGGEVESGGVEGFLASSVEIQAFDTQSRVHDAALSYENHVSVPGPLNNSRLDSLLGEANLRVGRADFAEDIACCTTVTRSGGAGSFGSSGDGLDIIDNETEMYQVMNSGSSRVKVVRAINWCGASLPNIVGCASTPGSKMVVVRMGGLAQEAVLWIHEYGHNTGLSHVSDPRYIMYGTNLGTNHALAQNECDSYHSPSPSTGMGMADTGACRDDDGDQVQDGIDNCPTVANTGQSDSDGDGVGDSCEFGCGNGIQEPSEDCDGGDLGGRDCLDLGYDGGVLACDGSCDFDESACTVNCVDDDSDTVTNCDGDCDDADPEVHPGHAEDCDGKDNDCDGTSDEGCPSDVDGDGVLDAVDNCPGTANSGQEDADADGAGDACDACPQDPDDDLDGDGVCGDVDNCPAVSNSDQVDTDGDGTGNLCEDPIDLLGPDDQVLYYPDSPPAAFNWDPAGMESFKVQWSKKTSFAKPRKSSGKVWLAGAVHTPDLTKWTSILRLGKATGVVYWRVKGKDSLGSRETTATRSLLVAPAESATVTAPADGASLDAATPPTIAWQANHNAGFRVVFSKRADLGGEPRYSSGDGYTLSGSSWTVPAATWEKIVRRLAGKSPDGTVYYAVHARDALGRKTKGEARILHALDAPESSSEETQWTFGSDS